MTTESDQFVSVPAEKIAALREALIPGKWPAWEWDMKMRDAARAVVDAVGTEKPPNPDPLCMECGHGHMPEDSCHTTSNEIRGGLDVEADAPTLPSQAIEAAAEALYGQQTKYRADLILEGITWANLEGPWRSDMLSEARAALSAALPYLGRRPTRPPRPPACKKCDALWTPGHVCPSPARDEKATLTDELWLIRNSKTGQWFMGSIDDELGIWAGNIAMSVVYTSPEGGPVYGLPEDGEWVRFVAHMAAPDELTAALASRNLARARQDEIADERDALRERVDALTTAARLITEDPGMNCHPGYEALRALLGHA